MAPVLSPVEPAPAVAFPATAGAFCRFRWPFCHLVSVDSGGQAGLDTGCECYGPSAAQYLAPHGCRRHARVSFHAAARHNQLAFSCAPGRTRLLVVEALFTLTC